MKKKLVKIFLSLVLVFSLSAIVLPVSAQEDSFSLDQPACKNLFEYIRDISREGGAGAITSPYAIFDYTQCLIINLINFLLEMGIVVAAFFIMMAGFNYMTAAGNPNKQAAAMKSLTSSAIGLALLIFSWSAYNFAVDVLEYNAFTKKFQDVEIPNIELKNSTSNTTR